MMAIFLRYSKLFGHFHHGYSYKVYPYKKKACIDFWFHQNFIFSYPTKKRLSYLLVSLTDIIGWLSASISMFLIKNRKSERRVNRMFGEFNDTGLNQKPNSTIKIRWNSPNQNYVRTLKRKKRGSIFRNARFILSMIFYFFIKRKRCFQIDNFLSNGWKLRIIGIWY